MSCCRLPASSLVFSDLRIDQQNYIYIVVFHCHLLLLVLLFLLLLLKKKKKKTCCLNNPCINLLFPAINRDRTLHCCWMAMAGPLRGSIFACLRVHVRKRDGGTITDTGRVFPGWHKLPAFLIEEGSTASEDQFSESSVHTILSRDFCRVHRKSWCSAFVLLCFAYLRDGVLKN